MKKLIFIFILWNLFFVNSTRAYNWPVSPFDSQHTITATLGEYRSGHLHAGVDIGETNVPIYAIEGGTPSIRSCVTIGRFTYCHITPDPKIVNGYPVAAQEKIGTIAGTHLHLNDNAGAANPLAGLSPFNDTEFPVVNQVIIEKTGETTFNIKANANDFRVCADGGNCGGHTHLLVSYEINLLHSNF